MTGIEQSRSVLIERLRLAKLSDAEITELLFARVGDVAPFRGACTAPSALGSLACVSDAPMLGGTRAAGGGGDGGDVNENGGDSDFDYEDDDGADADASADADAGADADADANVDADSGDDLHEVGEEGRRGWRWRRVVKNQSILMTVMCTDLEPVGG